MWIRFTLKIREKELEILSRSQMQLGLKSSFKQLRAKCIISSVLKRSRGTMERKTDRYLKTALPWKVYSTWFQVSFILWGRRMMRCLRRVRTRRRATLVLSLRTSEKACIIYSRLKMRMLVLSKMWMRKIAQWEVVILTWGLNEANRTSSHPPRSFRHFIKFLMRTNRLSPASPNQWSKTQVKAALNPTSIEARFIRDPLWMNQ